MDLRRNITFLLFICCLSVACMEIRNEKAMSKKPYFDLEGFVEQKIAFLDSISQQASTAPVVNREISIGGQKEDVTLSKENDEAYPIWQKELLLFKESDINKPVLLQAYEETKTASSTIYTAKESGLKVKKLEISYSSGKVSEISINLNEENYLYDSDKTISLVLQDGLIRQYSIDGYRKLVANEALEYKVNTQLLYP